MRRELSTVNCQSRRSGTPRRLAGWLISDLRQQEGSALIAALIMTVSIGLVVAGVGRLVTSSLRLTSSLEDASLAFAAAEAGIEEGLLRVRHNRDVELPTGTEMQETVLRANRVNLTTGQAQSGVTLGAGVSASSTEPQYDLRIWFKAPVVGSTDRAELAAATYPFKLGKDQNLDLTVSQLRNQSIRLVFVTPQVGQQTIIEAQFINTAGATVKEFRTRVSEDNLLLPTVPADAERLRLKPLILLTATDAPAPDGSVIHYGLAVDGQPPSRATNLLDTGATVIESTGYYGGAKRTLRAHVDRGSGMVLGIFDYVLFSNQDID